MMDTIKLICPCKERLTPTNSPFSGFFRNDHGFNQATLDGEKLQQERGLYYPTIKYCERPIGGGVKGKTYELSIEFSIPKILCGNNLYEFDEASFNDIVEVLHSRIVDMGITFIKKDEIPKLYVRRMDIGKNIVMKNHLGANSVIRSISSADINRHLNFDIVDYANGGQLIRFHSKHEDITIYNKSKELEQSSVDNKVTNASKSSSVLRFEVKMGGKKIIKRRMKDAGLEVPDPWEFQKLFTNKICKTLLLKRLEDIISHIPKIPLDDKDNIPSLFHNIMSEESQETKRGGFSKSLARLGLTCLLANGMDMQDIRTMAIEAFGQGSIKQLRNIQGSPDHHQLKNLIAVKAAVIDFEMLKPPQ